jgi:GTP-binding protein
MPRLPVVAIIGRPNTGKSTLFNRMLHKRLAIESDVPGTTRDHVVSKVEGEEVDYLLLDTGGIGGGTEDTDMEENVEQQTLLAIQGADLIVFTVNAKEELTKSDEAVVTLLRKKRKRHVPVILVATKCDNLKTMEEAEIAYHSLGIADTIIATSAIHGTGTGELEEAIEEHLKKLHFEKSVREATSEDEAPRIAIIGKPNVGKSSLVNALMSDAQRKTSPRIVSDIPGTTRDTADTIIKHNGKDYIFVDTAGLKRHAKTEEGIESYAMLRSIQAIEQAEVVLLLVDGTEPVSKQDKRIANIAMEEGKGLIILMNKVDLLDNEQKKERQNEIAYQLLFARFAPVIPASTKTRENLLKIFDQIDLVRRNRLRRIPTKELHRWFMDTINVQPVGVLRSCKHITQAEHPPPTFVLFVKNPKVIMVSQLRYLENRMREVWDCTGVPLRFITKGPKDRE